MCIRDSAFSVARTALRHHRGSPWFADPGSTPIPVRPRSCDPGVVRSFRAAHGDPRSRTRSAAAGAGAPTTGSLRQGPDLVKGQGVTQSQQDQPNQEMPPFASTQPLASSPPPIPPAPDGSEAGRDAGAGPVPPVGAHPAGEQIPAALLGHVTPDGLPK